MACQANKILITGGSGFIGTHLTGHLLQRGYVIGHLSRIKRNTAFKTYQWNVENGYIEPGALEQTYAIIHLAGATIDARWTTSYKKKIRDSRIKSTELLFNTLRDGYHSVRVLISASAVGYYGNCKSQWVKESFPPANDFLGETARQWELAAQRCTTLGIRTVILRLGIVLSKDGGALPKVALPIRLFLGAPVGNGKQYLSWIHIDDLCSIIIKAIEDENMQGPYNAVAPHPVIHKEMMRALSQELRRPLWSFSVPVALLRLFLGERAQLVTNSIRASAEKIQQAGYIFQYPELQTALRALYK